MEVEFSGDQEDDRPDCCQACEPASAALGGLKQSVDGFQKSIGLARLRAFCPDGFLIHARILAVEGLSQSLKSSRVIEHPDDGGPAHDPDSDENSRVDLDTVESVLLLDAPENVAA